MAVTCTLWAISCFSGFCRQHRSSHRQFSFYAFFYLGWYSRQPSPCLSGLSGHHSRRLLRALQRLRHHTTLWWPDPFTGRKWEPSPPSWVPIFNVPIIKGKSADPDFFSSFYISAWVFLGLWFIQQLIAGLGCTSTLAEQAESGVAWWAHIGGFVFGIAAALYFKNKTDVKAVIQKEKYSNIL